MIFRFFRALDAALLRLYFYHTDGESQCGSAVAISYNAEGKNGHLR